MSERARRKLGHTNSQGSTEPSRETSPSDTPEHKRPPQRPPPPNIHKNDADNEPVSTRNFFETLDWQQSNEPMLNDEEDGDDDDDDDGGGGDQLEQCKEEVINLTEGYVTASQNSTGQESKMEKLFDADFTQVQLSKEPETVDLLNIGGESAQSVTNSMNLLDIGSSSEPSNVDLLSGAMPSPVRSANQSPVPQPNVTLLGDTFDPFQQVPVPPSQSQPTHSDAFDLFGVSTSQTTSGLDQFGIFQSGMEPQSSKKSTVETDDFLSFVAMTPASQISAATTSPSDLAGGWNTNNLASATSKPPTSGTGQSGQNSSAFINLNSDIGMPRNASGTTLGMSQSCNKPNVGMPRNNSGPNLSGSATVPQKPADPFADLGNNYCL